MDNPKKGDAVRAAFDRLLVALRPKLHRYCARMTGSVIDGEDALQEALVKAIEAFPAFSGVEKPEAWLFRIAHNATLDWLRRRARRDARLSDGELEMVVDPDQAIESRQAAAASLRTFMRLPISQRSSVILMDVMGYSLDEIAGVTETTIPSIKAALHRGRDKLRELAREPDDSTPPALSAAERARLNDYVDRFNARDFDALRDLLAEEVKLDLVNRLRLQGKQQVGNYFTQYDLAKNWHFAPGLVEGRAAILVSDPTSQGVTKYFVLLEWHENRVAAIRDFLFAPYVIDGAELQALA